MSVQPDPKTKSYCRTNLGNSNRSQVFINRMIKGKLGDNELFFMLITQEY